MYQAPYLSSGQPSSAPTLLYQDPNATYLHQVVQQPLQHQAAPVPQQAAYGAPSQKAQRATQACQKCRTKKQKCDEERPCGFCKKEGHDCEYKDVPRSKTEITDPNILKQLKKMEDFIESHAVDCRKRKYADSQVEDDPPIKVKHASPTSSCTVEDTDYDETNAIFQNEHRQKETDQREDRNLQRAIAFERNCRELKQEMEELKQANKELMQENEELKQEKEELKQEKEELKHNLRLQVPLDAGINAEGNAPSISQGRQSAPSQYFTTLPLDSTTVNQYNSQSDLQCVSTFDAYDVGFTQEVQPHPLYQLSAQTVPVAPSSTITTAHRESSSSLMTFLPQVGIQLPSAASTTGPLRLEIVGDLDELLKGWSEEENLAGRRKVDFLKFQNGRTIVTTFAPVLHEDAVPSELRISIVKFGEMTEPCFTDFDFLRLLGYLLPIPINDSERFRHVLRNRSRSHYTREISPKNEEFSTLVSFEEPAVVDARTKQLVYSWRMLSLALEKAVQLVLLHLCVNGELS